MTNRPQKNSAESQSTPILAAFEKHQTAEEETKKTAIQVQRAEIQSQRAEWEARRSERLAAKLRELNIDPDTI